MEALGAVLLASCVMLLSLVIVGGIALIAVVAWERLERK